MDIQTQAFGYNVNSSLDLPYFQPVINSKMTFECILAAPLLLKAQRQSMEMMEPKDGEDHCYSIVQCDGYSQLEASVC